MSESEDSPNEVREAAFSVLTAILYSLAIIKGDNDKEQLSDFLDIILKSLYLQWKVLLLNKIFFYTCRF